MVLKYLHGTDSSEDFKMRKRWEVCRDCDFFHEGLRTCGEPGSVYRDDDGVPNPIGCWCYLPLAIRLRSKKCWAKEYGFDTGVWEQ